MPLASLDRMEPNSMHASAISADRTLTGRRWDAVKNRLRPADGTFVFAVRTTKIYCRPSCPARRPKPENILYFPSPREAEAAGYRACLRCRPNIASPNSDSARMVQQLCARIDAALADNSEARLTLAELSRSLGASSHQIERLFQRVLGITPRQYTDARRMTQLKSSLRKGEKIAMATYDAGFGSSSRLYERASSHMGMTPAVYRRGGAGMKIGYTIAPCTLGRVLVAATERGVSAVYLGDNAAALEKALAREYPRAEIRRDSNGMASGSAECSTACGAGSLTLDFPSTCTRRRFSGASGKSCAASRAARRALTLKSRELSASPARFAPLHAPARQIRSPSSFPAIA